LGGKSTAIGRGILIQESTLQKLLVQLHGGGKSSQKQENQADVKTPCSRQKVLEKAR
jgi:hypothetical protein